MIKSKLLYSGKAKSLYATDQAEFLIAEFRDDTTAFNGVKHEVIANKGLVNNLISSHIMQALAAAGVPTHFERVLSPTEVVVRKLRMIPVECVVRNITAGSLCRRLGIEEGKELNPPLQELYYKSDSLNDPMLTEQQAIRFEWATANELQCMQELALKINTVLKKMFLDAGMLLVDAKFEFGESHGEIYLGDEISPDSCRIWDAATREILDKDRFRKDLGGMMPAYQQIAQRLGVALPVDAA